MKNHNPLNLIYLLPNIQHTVTECRKQISYQQRQVLPSRSLLLAWIHYRYTHTFNFNLKVLLYYLSNPSIKNIHYILTEIYFSFNVEDEIF